MKIRIVTISTAWNTGIRAANSSKVSRKRMVIFKRIVTTMRMSNTRLMVSVSMPIWMISKMRWRREFCALDMLLGRDVCAPGELLGREFCALDMLSGREVCAPGELLGREFCALDMLSGREVFSALVLELALFCVLLLGFVMWSCP